MKTKKHFFKFNPFSFLFGKIKEVFWWLITSPRVITSHNPSIRPRKKNDDNSLEIATDNKLLSLLQNEHALISSLLGVFTEKETPKTALLEILIIRCNKLEKAVNEEAFCEEPKQALKMLKDILEQATILLNDATAIAELTKTNAAEYEEKLRLLQATIQQIKNSEKNKLAEAFLKGKLDCYNKLFSKDTTIALNKEECEQYLKQADSDAVIEKKYPTNFPEDFNNTDTYRSPTQSSSSKVFPSIKRDNAGKLIISDIVENIPL